MKIKPSVATHCQAITRRPLVFELAQALVLASVLVHSASAETPVRQMSAGRASLSSDVEPSLSGISPKVETVHQDDMTPWWEGASSNVTTLDDLEKLQPRRWSLEPSLVVGIQYDDNIGLSKTDKVSSAFYTAQPAVALKYHPMGSGLSFDISYMANFEWYDNPGIKNRVNQTVAAGINWDHGPTHLHSSMTYLSAESANIDVGDRVAEDSFNANIRLTYDYSEKTTFGITYVTGISSYDSSTYIGSTNQTVGVFGDWAATEKTKVGLGAELQDVQVSRGNNWNSYRALVRTTWAATSRLTTKLEVGPQFNEFSGGKSNVDFYWKVGVDYNLLDTGKTTLSFDLYRNQSPSAVDTNQQYTSTGVTASLKWNASARCQFSTAIGFENAKYGSTASNVVADRTDNIYFIRPSVSFKIYRWLTVSGFYQYTENSSSGTGSSGFERSTLGVSAIITF